MPKPPSLTFRRTTVQLRRDGRRVERDGVLIRDEAAGIDYEVVPVLHDGLPELVFYAETARMGRLSQPESRRSPLTRAYLAHVALAFLEDRVPKGAGTTVSTDAGLQIAFGAKRPQIRGGDRVVRPDDARLVELVRRYFADPRVRPRQMLVAEFGISPFTADDWIRRARALAPDIIPAPATGRGHKRETER